MCSTTDPLFRLSRSSSLALLSRRFSSHVIPSRWSYSLSNNCRLRGTITAESTQARQSATVTHPNVRIWTRAWIGSISFQAHLEMTWALSSTNAWIAVCTLAIVASQIRAGRPLWASRVCNHVVSTDPAPMSSSTDPHGTVAWVNPHTSTLMASAHSSTQTTPRRSTICARIESAMVGSALKLNRNRLNMSSGKISSK